MACRGVHFALSDEEAENVLAARDDEALMEVVEEIEEKWDKEWLQATDKAWDAIHRCLTDGTLRWERHATPLGKCVLGGRHLHKRNNYNVCYLSPTDVKRSAAAMEPIDGTWMRNKYFALPKDYGMELSEQDCEYTWAYFDDLKVFFSG